MLKTAFSTIACPDWTLERVARLAAEAGYDGVELRTFGWNATQLACDPALTAAAKVRRIFRDHGLVPACLSTGVGFDAPVRPFVLGRVVGDPDRTVRLAKAAIDLATQIECPYVRVFGFEIPSNESYKSGMARVVDRLSMVVDGARHMGVKVLIESGGTFDTAHQLRALIAAVGSPLLGAAYSPAAASLAGEDPGKGIEELRERCWMLKLRDVDASGRLCLPGEGRVANEVAVRTLARVNPGSWASVEWDRLWMPELEDPARVLPEAVRRVYAWMAATRAESVPPSMDLASGVTPGR